MTKYDSALFSPPAPLASVILRNPENGLEETDVPMLLDTGSDVTLVPQIYAKRLNLSVSREFELMGFDNNKSLNQTAQLHLIFEGKTFRGEYFLIEQDYGIIGRNILNFLNLQFDGKSQFWKIL
ncbi:MAG: hypothetical protein ACR2IA_10395 [Pyrinomonadaceae bacterium]